MDHNVLVAFDFDHTICEGNTDLVVQNLLPTEISEDVYNLRKSSGWIVYMNKIFELLHKNSVKAHQIENIIIGIPAVSGMQRLLTSLHNNSHEIIIISDSNSMFIDSWLRSRQLDRVVSQVFTNPARYDEGRLRVDPYHTQYTCQMSAVNLCKGQILTDYIQDKYKQGKSYERIVYIGDGRNDLCPILRLSEADLACPRKGYSLINRLNESTSMSTKAKIVPWENGTDLQCSLKQFIELSSLTQFHQ
ncbi:PREDICTED: pyridoxal phosphate phosphatase PHOSPHO2 [Cyphomyrmex costatus]|uniref:Pyridoxal phosphate phosphatase PHOSPHO2 n=1 Tax=Cyphomyrmex costatus TaxID=456900 RepID=A0A151IJS2_9HYME|nr:PREDICTED: pyridoxal phosphate phosphatase PHOSPHO2 [Cyphomyrmex costatus]KYN03884.1 Pyridoxal phosphate phosphatase PHOSPHO2 [Cyphomyrmex costatus]